MIKVKFTKVYDRGLVGWETEESTRSFKTKKQLITQLGLKNIKKVGKCFFITDGGRRNVINIYEGEK